MAKPEGTPNISGSREPIPHNYFFEGSWRRELHRFGRRGIDFYAEDLKRMDIGRTDSAADIGAGMGDDAKHVARHYRPRVLYMIEPKIEEFENSDDKYYPLELDLEEQGFEHVVLLPSATSRNFRPILNRGVPEEELTYLAPISAVAEALPFPDQSITRLWANHSAYEFSDLETAIRQFARVLAPNGLGSAVTNGPGDKLRFKEFMSAANNFFGSEAATVSSRVDYHDLTRALSKHFPFIKVMVYEDEMVVDTPKRQTYYMVSWNSYRRSYDVSTAEWLKFTKEKVEGVVQTSGFEDTIDIAAIYFAHNEKALSHIEGDQIFNI